MKAKRTSKRAYLARRKRRVRELYLDGLDPRDIAVKLVEDGTIETTDESLESAARLVRGDVAEIKAEIESVRIQDAQVAGSERDALERKLKRLRAEYERQVMIANGEPDETGVEAVIVTTMDTPNGPLTSQRPKWPASSRQKASKDASILAEKIGDVEIALARVLDDGVDERTGEKRSESFVFSFPQTGTMSDLIAMNLERGKVN
jgi:hypothetical protein